MNNNEDYRPKYLTSYYYCKLCPESKSHKFECVKSTGGCYEFDEIAKASRNKRFAFYLTKGAPKTFDSTARARASYTMTNNRNISGIYLVEVKTAPDDNAVYGYGDVVNRGLLKQGYSDCSQWLFFRIKPDFTAMEIFEAERYTLQHEYHEAPKKRCKRGWGKRPPQLTKGDCVKLFAQGRFWRDVDALRHRARLLVVEPIKYPSLFE